jgi:hypothetical protein
VNPNLSAEDIAVGYKHLLEVERGWKRHEVGHRPVPRLAPAEDRIRAHVIHCWLALLPARIAENTAAARGHNCAASSTRSTHDYQLHRFADVSLAAIAGHARAAPACP